MSTPLLAELRASLTEPDQVTENELTRHAMAHDASHFLLLPSAVVTPRSGAEVARLLELCRRRGVPLTFRSGGTSLSGQAVTDSLLVDTRRHFRQIEILDDGLRVRVQPGVTVRQLNARLARYGRKFGPDPASEAACTIGGVLANNASGMACGTVENSYRTLESVVAVLPSGTTIDTGAPDADERLRAQEPDLYKGLLELRERVLTNPRSLAVVTQQFAMKNTMGYGLNALVEYDTPAEILTHLLVGSEGTLVFVTSATFRTVPLRTQIASALLVFDDLFAASAALPALVATGAATLELMDATSLRVGQSFPDCPPAVARIAVDRQAALLLEYQATAAEELAELTTAAAPTLADLATAEPVELTGDAGIRGGWWKLRKGLYSSVAGARPQGSTALLEDIVVPVPALAQTCRDLAVLFDRYDYRDSVVFGHAKDGNIHFMLTDRFETDEQLGRYSDFTEEMVDLVLGHDGSLKAEHGTAEEAGDAELAGRLHDEYSYAAVQTCAVDGMCQTACPVLINTGDLVKRLRKENQPKAHAAVWTTAAKGWSAVTRGASTGLTAMSHLPGALAPVVAAANRGARTVAGTDWVPLWSRELPGGGPRRRRPAPDGEPAAVYLPACVNTMFGPADGGPGVQGSFERLCARAGITLLVPTQIESLCCGTPWSSKGIHGGYDVMRQRVLPIVYAATRNGELPVVTDASSCTEGFHAMLTDAATQLRVVDAMQFVVDQVLPKLGEVARVPSVSVHPTCSSTRLQLNATLAALAGAVAEDVHIPQDWGCCAFAGDRGMLHPELTATATAPEAAEVSARGATAHVSCNRTCELGMTRATGQPYRHVLDLLDEVTTS